MRLSPCFRHCETVQISHFFPRFFYYPKRSPINFLIFCNRMDVQKTPKGPHVYIFWHYATYQRLQKIFFSFFSFLRAFVVASCRKSGFRVLLSLRYGSDLGRSGLFDNRMNDTKYNMVLVFTISAL